MNFDPKNLKRMIASDDTVLEGMGELYADRTESYGVRYVPDIVYTVRDGMELHLQMLYPSLPAPYIPEGVAQRAKGTHTDNISGDRHLPCVVYVKGSAWGKQDCYIQIPMYVDIARAGYVVAVVEYRPAAVEPFPGFVSDAKAAICFLRANCDEFDIDPNRIAVMGESSGGHTSLMVGSTGWFKDFDDGEYPDISSEVQACISLYGVSDLTQFGPGSKDYRPILLPLILGEEGSKRPDAAEYISPVTYIRKENDYPPFLLIHGDRDATVPFEQSVIMADKLRECGKHVEIWKVKGAGHGSYFWTKEVLETIVRFLKAYV